MTKTSVTTHRLTHHIIRSPRSPELYAAGPRHWMRGKKHPICARALQGGSVSEVGSLLSSDDRPNSVLSLASREMNTLKPCGSWKSLARPPPIP